MQENGAQAGSLGQIYKTLEVVSPARKLDPTSFLGESQFRFKVDTITLPRASTPNLQMTAVTSTPPPLTTTFYPPSSCFKSFFHSGVDSLGPSPSASECHPSGWNASVSYFFFSPGWICPFGYTSGSIGQATIATVTETRVTCCPRYA